MGPPPSPRGPETTLTCAHCRDAPDFFGDKLARFELWRYRRRGPARTTRMLLRALLAEGAAERSLLDIGGGVGALQHALLAAGAPAVTSVDAAPAYQRAAHEEQLRQGTAARVELYMGDFVEVAPALPRSDVVTLDRVLCCYPDVEALVAASGAKTGALWGAVFPREHFLVRAGTALVNALQRLRGRAFRVYVHPARTVEAALAREGLLRCFHAKTPMWQVTVWKRPHFDPSEPEPAPDLDLD